MSDNDIIAENPETDKDETLYEGPMTVADLIQQLQSVPPEMEVRMVVRSFDEEEGRDTDENYPVMYVEEFVDTEPESETVGEKFIGVVCDIRDPDDEDEDDFPDDTDA